jgi:putative sterol carrier protein
MVEQTQLHSNTSQYGSMSRGMRFMLPELRARMQQGLDEIRSGRFADEWAAEQEAGCPTLEDLRLAAQSLPLAQLERDLRAALGGGAPPVLAAPDRGSADRGGTKRRAPNSRAVRPARRGLLARFRGKPPARTPAGGRRSELLSPEQVEPVLRAFLASAAGDSALQAFGEGKTLTTHYLLSEPEVEFHLSFDHGRVTGKLGAPPAPAEVCIQTQAGVLDDMLTGRINAMRAAMSGKLVFSGEARLAMSVQRIQDDLCRLYRAAREQVLSQDPA